MDPYERLVVGGRIFTRPAGTFQDPETGRTVEYGDALAIEYRGRKAVVEVAALPTVLDVLENDSKLRSILGL